MAYTWEADSTTATTATTYILKNGDTKVAEITGLKANLITGSDPVTSLTGVEISGESGSEVITVAAGALDDTSKTSGVSLTGGSYTLKLDEGVDKYGKTITPEAVTVSNGTATLTGTLSAGWKKAETGESYTYKAAATGQTLATVTGLGDGATTSGNTPNVSYANNKITLKKGALGSNDIAIANATGVTGDYDLALDTTDTDYNSDTKTIGAKAVAEWRLEGDAKYYSGTSEGWTLVTGDHPKTITHTASTVASVVTISGLSDDIKVNAEGKLGTNTGTNGAFEEGVTFGKDDGNGNFTASAEGKVIQLKKAVLGKSEAKNITVEGEGYTLLLASGIKTEAKLTDQKLDFTGSTPTVTGTVNEYWTVQTGNTSIKYKAATTPTLATITGLGSKASDTGNVTADFASDTLTVTVKEAALGNSTVTLKPRTAEQVGISAFSAEFNLIKNDGSAIADNKVGLDDGDKYWAYQGTTAYYRYDTTAGFTFNSSTKPQEITYTAAKTGNNATTLATITNLTTNLSSLYVPAKPATEAVKDAQGNITTPAQEAKPASITGITVSDTQTGDNYVITLDKDVLGTDKNNATTLDGDSYILALATGVPNEAKTDVKVWTFGTNNATLTSSKPAYWILDQAEGDTKNKKVTYTAEADKKTLATVTGLKELDASAITDSIVTYEEYSSSTSEGVETVTAKGKIKLKSGFLDGKNVKLVSSDYYTLDLDGVSAPNVNPTWSINGTTATYSGEVTAAGYEVKTDGSEIVYTPKSAEGQKTTLATITGLKSGLGSLEDSAIQNLFTFGTESGKPKEITVSADALGASNVSVTGTNYTLALPTGIKTGTYTAATADTPAKTTYSAGNENVWRLKDSTTAVYKQVTPAYYTLDESNNTSIIYTAEADATVKKTVDGKEKDVPAIYATVSGLKSGVVEENGQIGTKSSDTFTQGITLGTVTSGSFNAEDGTVLQMSKAVLGTGEITVAKGDAAASDYTFVLIDSENPGQQEATNPSDKTWTGGNGTFKYVGSLTEGWTLDKQNTSDTVDNKITYKAAEGAHEFAKVEGLSSDVTAAALNGSSKEDYLTVGKVSGVSNVITLKAKALGGKDISVTGNDGYTLALDSTGINTDNTQKNIWAVATDGTTYTYKTVEQDFYAYDKKKNDQNQDVTDNTKIKYTEQKDKSTIATFAGLKSGLLANDGTMPDTAIAVENQKFTVKTAALDEKDVTISNLNTNYSVEGSFGTDNLKPGTAYWDLDSTTAKYQHDVTAGYTLEDVTGDTTKKTIKYHKEDTVVEAEIAGLKSGLKVKNTEVSGVKTSTIDGITVDGTAFKLDASKVLTTTNATLKNNKKADNNDYTYTLALDSYTKPANGTAWVVKGTTATLVNYAPEFYAAKDSSNNKEIVYTKAKVGTADYSSTMTIPPKQTLATIEGLKSGLKPDENGQIDGLTVTANTNVTLSKNVLGTTNVKITKGNADSGTIETLALDSTGDANHKVYAPTESGKWSVKNGVPTYTSTTAAGYKLDNSTGTGDNASPTKGQIVYSPQKVIKVTVNGLDKVAINADGSQVGKASGGSYYGITSNFEVKSNDITGATESLTGTLKLGKDVLNKKNVTVSTSGGTADVTFELDTGVAATTSAAVWNKAKGKTVAKYTETTAAGYSLPTDNKKVIYSSKATTKTLATVTGLKKDLVPTNGELTGVTVTAQADNTSTTDVDESKIGIITLDKSVLNTSNVTLGKNDNYWLQLADAEAYKVQNAVPNQVWTYNKSKGTATVRVGTTEGWAIKQTIQKVNNVDTLVTDPKTIVYTAAKYTNVATVSGLSKKLTLTDGHIEGLDVNVTEVTPPATPSPNVAETGSSAEAETPDKYTGTISITSDVLNNATVKVEVPNAQQSKYSFEFSYDKNDIKAPTDGSNYWRGTGNGTVTYQYDTSAGYTPNNADDPTVLTYSKAKTTVHATLSGLSKTVADYNTVKDKDSKGKPLTYKDPAELPGIEVTLAQAAVTDDPTTTGVNEAKEAVAGTITLKASAVTITPTAVSGNFTNKVTLKKGKVGDYNLNIDEIDVEEAGAKWTASGTTATYKDYDAAGYTLDTKTKKTATFVKETAKATLATVKGIKKLDAAAATAFNANPATYVSVEGDKITLTEAAVGTSTISLTQGKDRDKKVTTYYFDTNVSTSINPRDAQTPYWTFSKGTATLKQLTKDGYTPNDDTKPTKFVYSKDTTATLATVKGLSTTLAVPTAEQIEATKNDSNKLENIKLYATKDSGTKDSKGKAIYVPNAENVVATYDATAKTITLNKDAFNKKTVTVTVPKNSDQYTLKLGTDLGDFANYTRNTTGWTVSGTTATYRNYNQLFYTPATDGKSIVYTAETKSTTYATVTGLKKDIDASILNESGVWTPDATNNASNANPANGGVLTLDARHLGTSTVKLTTNLTNTKNKDSFALALSISTDTNKKVTTSTLTANSSSVTADNGKAIIKGKVSEGFAVDFGGKQITYTNANAATKDVTIATVTGLKKAASINVDSRTGQITLDSDDLTTKNVSVVTSKGNTTYTLNYDPTAPTTKAENSSPEGTEAAPNNPSKKTPGWTISKNNGTLKGYVTQEGFTKSASGTTLTYTAKTVVNEKTDKEGNKTYTYADTATLATIKGLNDSAGLDAPTSGTISLSKNDIKGSSVTINGGTFAVSIDDTYKDKTINGSAGADNITANGTGLTINTGKGDDNITLGIGTSRTKGNTLVYSTGDGNDVVANFIAGTDKLQIKKGTATVEKVGSDFIVRVGTGSIKLTGAASSATSSLAIVNSSGTEVTYSSIPETSTGGSPLLVDDNYFTDPTQISEIVKPFEASFTPYEFKTNFNLTKEESFVPTATYTNKK